MEMNGFVEKYFVPSDHGFDKIGKSVGIEELIIGNVYVIRGREVSLRREGWNPEQVIKDPYEIKLRFRRRDGNTLYFESVNGVFDVSILNIDDSDPLNPKSALLGKGPIDEIVEIVGESPIMLKY